MIVQSALPNDPHFVMTMAQHTELAGQFAAHFGNNEFTPVEPREVMLYIISNHDAGWRDLDAQALRDPATGLPYNLVQTPFEYIIKTSAASPEFKSQHHPYCGLISSMHSWGLYNGLYGMSDKVLLDGLAADNRVDADRMLDGEIGRQNQLRDALSGDSATASWIEESHVLQNYKQLQFFDTLALYFNCTHAEARETTTFSHVPMDGERDVDVTIQPLGDDLYALSPYPFNESEVEFTYHGRYLEPCNDGTDVRAPLAAAPAQTQSIRLSSNPES
mgnify:CR=1 FL=1